MAPAPPPTTPPVTTSSSSSSSSNGKASKNRTSTSSSSKKSLGNGNSNTSSSSKKGSSKKVSVDESYSNREEVSPRSSMPVILKDKSSSHHRLSSNTNKDMGDNDSDMDDDSLIRMNDDDNHDSSGPGDDHNKSSNNLKPSSHNNGSEQLPKTIPGLFRYILKALVNHILLILPIIFRMIIFVLWATLIVLISTVKGSEARSDAIYRVRHSMQTFFKGYNEEGSVLLKKVFLTFWFISVAFAILSLLGYHPAQYLFGDFGFAQKEITTEPPLIPEIAEEDMAALSMVQTESRKKLTKKEEIKFACDEIICNDKCHKKASKKCSKSEGCMRERAKICAKRCRRSRCENRCKDEPALGYVEREMKIEKCKEACQTAKCKTKCDEEFQSCKAKCFTKAKKIVCPDSPLKVEDPGPVDDSNGDGGDEIEMSNSDAAMDSNDDDLPL